MICIKQITGRSGFHCMRQGYTLFKRINQNLWFLRDASLDAESLSHDCKFVKSKTSGIIIYFVFALCDQNALTAGLLKQLVAKFAEY